MKGFIEIIARCGRPQLINVRHIEKVVEIDNSICEIYMHDSPIGHFLVNLPYNRVVELIKEAVE